MSYHPANGERDTRAVGNWPDALPRDLALRLADALRYEGCTMDDLWDEIRDWLCLNRVAVTEEVRNRALVEQGREPGIPALRTISQQGSGMNLTRLIYTSKHASVDVVGLDGILQKSRANNVRDRITGALVIGESAFMQLIEGPRDAIGNCFMRIMQDRRHTDVLVISCGDVGQRLFHEWSMHRIEISKVKQEILSRYIINGRFTPNLMSEFAIGDLCRTLAAGNWQAEAA